MEKAEPEGSGQTLMREPEKRMTHLQLRKKEKHEGKLQKHLSKMEHQVTNLRGKIQQRNEQLQDVTKQMTIFLGQIQEKDEETANLHNQTTALMQQLEEKEQIMKELEITLSVTRNEISELRLQPSDWIISRDCIQLTGRRLGIGAWGTVLEGKFCGYPVAVKQIHEVILSPFSCKLFEREMDIASKCRHPCLLQFIGATIDEGNPLFVTELMETSLRDLLQQRAPSESEISSISLDVAHALNYLHQKRPSPIVHRDISSANVLLWRKGEHFRGKVSDYGTATFVQQFMTVGQGAMIYSAPETCTRVQTVKVSCYLFIVNMFAFLGHVSIIYRFRQA